MIIYQRNIEKRILIKLEEENSSWNISKYYDKNAFFIVEKNNNHSSMINIGFCMLNGEHFKITEEGKNRKFKYENNRLYIEEIVNDSDVLVVMPTYNRSNNIKNTIQLIDNQTYKKSTLLIIDDGSTPEHKVEFNLLKDKYRFNNKIIFLENNVNKHIAYTLNKGIEYFLNNEQYKYFTWISDDNHYEQTYINDLKTNNNYFKYSSFTFINLITNKTHIVNQKYDNMTDLLNNFKGCASFMWTKDAIKEIGFYQENINGCEDYEYLLRTFNKNKECFFIDKSLMKYNRHSSSLYVIDNKNIRALKNNIDAIFRHFNNNSSSFVYYSKTKYKLLFQRPHQIMRFYNKNDNKCFIGEIDGIKYEDKYKLLIVPYKLKDIVYNAIREDIITYYTDTRLYEEVNNLKGKKIYDLIDAPINDFAVWKPNLENSVKNADYVIYSHPDLIKFLNEIDDTKKYNYISNACDYEFFSKAKNRIGRRPVDFPNTNKQILGYYGSFAKWIDYNFIKKCADNLKYHIVMIGGIKENSNYNYRFNHKNITWLDHKPYEELAYYLSWFDTCLLPFKKCELTKYVNPCKLWEYMASEKKIIKHNVNIENNNIIKYENICVNLYNTINNIFIPSIAILIPCYNEDYKYLKDCIESALNINYARKDIILLNDGSKDINIFKDFSDKITILTQENKKLPTTLNNLFCISKKYDFVTWGSSDNMWHKDFINVHLKYHSENIDITYSNYYIIDENNKPIRNNSYRPKCLSKKDNSIVITNNINTNFKKMIDNSDNFIGASFLINSRVFSNKKSPYVNCQGIEDFIFWVEAYLDGYKFKKINETLYYYRFHLNSMSGSTEQNIFDKNMIIYKVNSFCNNIQLNNYNFSRKKFYKNTNNEINFIKEQNNKNKIFNYIYNIYHSKKWFIEEFKKWIYKKDIKTIKQYFKNIEQLEDCKFEIPKPLIFKKNKVLLLTQNFSKGGLENIMILNAKTEVYDVILSSFENSNVENILSFNNDINKLISYINNNKIDIVNLHYIAFDISLLKSKTNTKIIMTNHNTYYWFDKNMRNLFKTFNNYVDYFINVSNAVKDFNIKYVNNEKNKSIVINNCCEFNIDNINNNICSEFKDKKIYICVGSIVADKGQLELIKGFKTFYDNENNNNIILILLGKVISTNYIEQINDFINKNNIDYIYLRECKYNDVNTYLHICDTFILPSYIEGCSQAIKEAIIKNKKIIISENVGSNNYLYKKYNNIFLIKNVEKQYNLGADQQKYYDFLFKYDKSQVINNIYNSLIKFKEHIVIKNNNLEDINYLTMNKKLDLVYFNLLKNNTNIINIF